MASALGDVTFGNGTSQSKRTVCLMASGASQAAPTLSTHGVQAYEGSAELWAQAPAGAFFLGKCPAQGASSVQVISTAGSGVMTATVTVWGYLAGTGIGKWVVVKKLNGGSAIPESSISDYIGYSEVVDGLGAYDRIAVEVATAGTTPTVEVYLTTTAIQ